jgi:hypothetical protein
MELAKAILAAAEKDFSSFKEVIGDAAEEKFGIALADRVGEESGRVFEGEKPLPYQDAKRMGAEVLSHRKNGDKNAEAAAMSRLRAHVEKYKLNRHLTMPGMVD